MKTETRYKGLHREDSVGSLIYSDDDLLSSERIGKRVKAQVALNRFDAELGVLGTPDCETH